MLDANYPIFDPGNAPRYHVNGLCRVVPMDPFALFSFHIIRPPSLDQGQEGLRVIEVELLAPIEAVGPAFDMAIMTLGARTMVNLAGHAIGHAVRRWMM